MEVLRVPVVLYFPIHMDLGCEHSTDTQEGKNAEHSLDSKQYKYDVIYSVTQYTS